MNAEQQFVVGFVENETKRIESFLDKLLPHLEVGEFVIVGGLAIRFHLASRGVEFPTRPFNDLDLIVKTSRTLRPSVTRDFLISHYHLIPGQVPYIALVDAVNHMKADIFSYDPAPEKVVAVGYKNYHLDIVSVEDQLAKTVADCTRIFTDKFALDPKQIADAKLLMEIADMEKAERIWRSRVFSQHPKSLIDEFADVLSAAEQFPNRLKKNPFRKPRDYVCAECAPVLEFPLTTLDKIHDILRHDD
ncbi:hypothetical protein HZB69_02225 [Candidatus Amesbacteria bacterium]|nr:hypothetical protein [Candidatus Amesbacteria bacterium]